jgi:hypothetical protein
MPENVSSIRWERHFATHSHRLARGDAYGRGEGGYCIGFDAAKLDAKSSSCYFFFSPAIYDRREQATFFEQFLDWALDEYLRVASLHQAQQDQHRRAWAHVMLCRLTAAEDPHRIALRRVNALADRGREFAKGE